MTQDNKSPGISCLHLPQQSLHKARNKREEGHRTARALECQSTHAPATTAQGKKQKRRTQDNKGPGMSSLHLPQQSLHKVRNRRQLGNRTTGALGYHVYTCPSNHCTRQESKEKKDTGQQGPWNVKSTPAPAITAQGRKQKRRRTQDNKGPGMSSLHLPQQPLHKARNKREEGHWTTRVLEDQV